MSVHTPRILPPVATGDGTVWVSGVSPGATVAVRQGGTSLGQRLATDPVIAVPVTGVSGPVHAVAHLGPESRASAEVSPVRDPGEAGDHPRTAVRDVSYGELQVPEHATPEGTEGGFDAPLTGRVWLPAGSDGEVPG